jgi:hypothetical protein
MKHLYTLLLIAGTAAATLLSCDKDNSVIIPEEEIPTVNPPANPDEPAGTGAIIVEPPILPGDATHYPDNHYRVVQRSTENNAFTLIIVGDGFGQGYGYDDFKIGGYYDSIANSLVNGFKRNYVIRDYLSYFNIVIYYAHSPEHGVDGGGGITYNNPAGGKSRFGSHLGDDVGGMIGRSLNTLAAELTNLTNLKDVFVIFPLVGNIGASPHFAPDGTGLGWAPYPYWRANESHRDHIDFYWMIHEFVGHVIGRFPDVYGAGPFGIAQKNEIDAAHADNQLWMIDYNKDYPTVDAPPDSTDIFWSRFLYEPAYEGVVGIHKGAFNRCNYNIYVPQPNNTNGMCTNGVMTYDAPSRYQLWMRLQKTVGRDYSLERFFAYDAEWNVKQTNYRADPPELQ